MPRKTRRKTKGRRKGGMLNAATKIATTTASAVVQKAALEYGQRRSSKIITSGFEDPESLKDPSLYFTGKRSASFKTTMSPELFTSKYTPEMDQSRNTPIMFDENINKNYNPNIIKPIATVKRGLKILGGVKRKRRRLTLKRRKS